MRTALPFRHSLLLFGILAVIAPLEILDAATPDSELQSLIDVERSFAETSRTKGMKEAFLSFLGEGSVVFRPGPVDAREWIESRPNPDGALLWEPAFAEIASTGALGYTTGPWEYRTDDGSSWGHYVTIWSRQSDGSWKVLVDLGNNYPEPASQAVELERLSAPRKQKDSSDVDPARLRETESAFSRRSIEDGTAAAYSTYVARNVRLYRNGTPPTLGVKQAQALLATLPGALSWEPDRVGIEGHLGYTWGRAQLLDGTDPVEGFTYLRIWREESRGKWRVALEIMVPGPI
jgi:ketosteroid isomerase-like protein